MVLAVPTSEMLGLNLQQQASALLSPKMADFLEQDDEAHLSKHNIRFHQAVNGNGVKSAFDPY